MADATERAEWRTEIREALALLGKRRLVLAIHDASFPSAPGEDTGRGSPYTRGGRDFLGFAHGLGFDGVQLGPPGRISAVNPSPYDGTLFSRGELSLDLHALAREPGWGGLLTPGEVEAVVAAHPAPESGRAQLGAAFEAYRAALDRAWQRFTEKRAAGDPSATRLAEELDAFRAEQGWWLEADALYAALEAAHGGRAWPEWGAAGAARDDRHLLCPPPGAEARCRARRRELVARHAAELERYALVQLVAHRQHGALRRFAGTLGLALYGDVQVGFSVTDTWSRRGLLLDDYLLGAPPSRTNPEGQPWGYGVLDPAQYREEGGGDGPVLRFLRRRLDKLLTEYDGLRVDHPHGLVCPWVYRRDDPDPLHAVQHGARLFSSPALPDHPGLARFALVPPEQLARDGATPRHADDWVRALTADQVARYAVLLDALVDAMVQRGRSAGDLVCEVLSTQPFPLALATQRHGLGRFRVIQKANLEDPVDVYRAENARPEDWVMVGTHDTPPLWHLARRWLGTPEADRQAAYLARQLRPDGAGVEALAGELAASPERLAEAKLAQVFLSPAENAMVFFADLLGLEAIYNRPGTRSPDNWTLRVPQDYAETYPARARAGAALNLPRVLALALRARGLAAGPGELAERLENLATTELRRRRPDPGD